MLFVKVRQNIVGVIITMRLDYWNSLPNDKLYLTDHTHITAIFGALYKPMFYLLN